jgi:hypothetical protein
MVKLKIKIGDSIHINFEGDHEEASKLIHTLHNEHIETSKTKDIEVKTQLINEHLPTLKEIEAHLKKQPNYQHTTYSVQEHFFGKRFPARGGTKKKFDILYRRLVIVRKNIRKREGGRWIDEWDYPSDGGKTKIFRFTRSSNDDVRV